MTSVQKVKRLPLSKQESSRSAKILTLSVVISILWSCGQIQLPNSEKKSESSNSLGLNTP